MKKDTKISVSTAFYGGGSGIDNILNDYYEREIRKIGSIEEQNLARKVIEEGLIIDGSRVSVSEAGILNQFNIPMELLNRLRESRIIRAQTTHLGKAYEVSHDTLVLPILKSYEIRKLSEERVENARRLKKEHEALTKEKKKKRRASLLAALGFLLFFIALIALSEAFQLNKKAQQQTRIAKSNELTAHSIFATQKNNDVTKGYGLAKAAFETDDNTESRKGLFSVFYKSIDNPLNFFYVKNLNCRNSLLLSAYYSPFGNYILANSWNKTARLWDKSGTLIREFDINNKKPIKRAFFSPDEKYLLTLKKNQTAEIWELKGITTSSKPVAILSGHTKNITGAAFSSDGQKILTYAPDGKVFLWDSNWKQIAQINDTDAVMSYANFSEDGSNILTIQDNGDFQIRDKDGKVLKKIASKYGEYYNVKLYDVSFSSNSSYFAIGTSLDFVQVWNWKGQLITELKGHEGGIRDIDWSPDNRYIATTSPDKTVKIWNINGDVLTNITGHHATVYTVDFSLDGTNLLTASVDNTAKIWTLEGDLVATLSGHFEALKGAEYAPDGNSILSFSETDNTIKEWINVENPVIDLPVASEEVFKGKFSPDGKKIITCGSLIAMIWDYDSDRKSFQQLARLEEHNKAVYYNSFSPNENFIATGSSDHTAKIWNLNGELIADLTGHTEEIKRVQWSPDSEELVTASFDNTAKVWTRSGDLLYTLTGHSDGLFYAAFSPDGKHIVTTSNDKMAKVWNRKGKLLLTLEGHKGKVVDAEFSPDGDFVVTASGDNTGRIWDLREGQNFGQFISLDGHSEDLLTVDVSPDGNYIVTASEDKNAIIWDAKGKLIATLSGHERPLSKAIFSYDGQMVATSSSDNTAKVWSLDGTLISDLVGHKNSINDVNFSPDNKTVLTSGSDHRAKIWPILTIDQVIEMLDKKEVEELNEETKKKYKIE